jgi:hypothetical protein
MRFTKAPPPRKRKRYSNAVTDHPTFRQLVNAMHGGVPRAALSFDLSEAKTLGVDHPWRVAADALRKIIADENLPYVASKYQTDSGGWAVQVVRQEDEKPAAMEEGPAVKSA